MHLHAHPFIHKYPRQIPHAHPFFMYQYDIVCPCHISMPHAIDPFNLEQKAE